MRRAAVPVAIALVLGVWAPAAPAASVAVFDGAVRFTASPGEVNHVSIALVGGQYEVRDAMAGVSGVGPECVDDVGFVRCDATGVALITVSLNDDDDRLTVDAPTPLAADGGEGADVIAGGAGNDEILGNAGFDTVSGGAGDDSLIEVDSAGNHLDGGPGSDRLTGGMGADELRGGAGDDPRLYGGDGDDVVDGGEGDDVLEAGFGPAPLSPDRDVFIGGPGVDRTTYAARGAGVRVSIGNGPDDGVPGEGDDVAADVESVVGGAGNDTLTGGPGPDALDGGGGADTISGGDGADVLAGGAGGSGDTLDGGPGDDRLDGAAGGDRLDGGDGTDVLAGGEDADELAGGTGPDALEGGPADDTLDGGLGPDRISGGDGNDTVRYAARSGPVQVTLDGRPNDGEVTQSADGRLRTEEGAGSEGDDVDATTESATGGGDDDTLSGNGAANRIDGGAGEDVLAGGRGADVLSGGGRGDAILSRDGTADRVSCGLGFDYVVADRRDQIAPGARCEFVDDGSRSAPRARRDVAMAPRCEGGRDADIAPPGTDRPVPVGRRVLVPVGARIDSFDCSIRLTVAVGGGRKASGTLRGGATAGRGVPRTAGEMRLTQRRDADGVVQTHLRTTDCLTGATAARRPLAVGARFPRRRYRRRFGRIAFPVTVRTGSTVMETQPDRGAVSWEVDDRCGGGATVRVTSGRLAVVDLASDRRVVLGPGERFP